MSNELTKIEPTSSLWAGNRIDFDRERLEASYTALFDEKHRRVHGYAIILTCTTDSAIGVTFTNGTVAPKRFAVELVATRDGSAFGASRGRRWFDTKDDAIAYASKALAAQGRRYAVKYGAAAA